MQIRDEKAWLQLALSKAVLYLVNHLELVNIPTTDTTALAIKASTYSG